MSERLDPIRDLARRPLVAADAWLNRLYGWRANPLYQSGALVVLSFVVMLATGLYLLLFYRIGAPYDSVARIEGQAWLGRWIRALHRYAADLAVVAAVLHALRMFAQGRSWGARTRAWVSGLVLLFMALVSGWTGYVMVWDSFGQVLAVEGARLMDALPIFSEPLGRAFAGEQPLPSAFFFLNLFAHIAVPVGMALVFWIHVSRLARPVLLPPRRLAWAATALLCAAAVLVPAPLGPRADPLAQPGVFPVDWFYGFWLPASRAIHPSQAWLAFAACALAGLLVPWWSRPSASRRPSPSAADEHLCTGCLQCSIDCPYQAISMVDAREIAGAHAESVARVDPGLCVACGICSGSCAPMAVGPPLRTGRDQLAGIRSFLEDRGTGDVVVVACRNGAGRIARERSFEGARVHSVSCAGNLHSSVVEYLVRAGAAGVLLASCPPRDCRNREGPRWQAERLLHGREAELQDRVDRRRLEIVYAGEGERARVSRALAVLRARVSTLAGPRPETAIEVAAECEAPRVEAGS